MTWQSLRLGLLWCWHQLLLLALVALVGVAVLVGVARQVLPAADAWRPDLERALSERMGLPVTVASLSARLEGVSLQVHLDSLQLHDPAQPEQVLLRIPEIELRPAIWASLWHAEPRMETVLRGVELHLDQLPDGRLRIRELDRLEKSDPESARQALRFALRQPALAVGESRVTLALQGFPALRLSGVELVNLNDHRHYQGQEQGQHRLAGSLRVEGHREPLQVNLVLRGDALDWQKGDVDAWLHLPVLALDDWLPEADVAGLRLRQLTGGGDYWFHFRQGRLEALEARPQWPELVIQGRQGPLKLDRMSGELVWRREANGWQLAARQLQGQLDGRPWPLPVLALRKDADNLHVAAQHAGIDGMASLLKRLPLPPDLLAWLKDASPGGRVTALRADLVRGEGQDWQPRRVALDVQGLRLAATAGWPGADGIAGWLQWTPGEAWLGLDTRDARLDLPAVYREPVVMQHLAGHVRLRREGEILCLDSDRLRLHNADARGNALLRLSLPLDDPAAARLSLLGGLRQGRVASAWRYVPWSVAGDKTLGWLQSALQGGVVTQGDFLYDGPLHHRDDLPPATLQMRFAVEQGRLDYDDDWPGLRDLSAVVHISGRRLTIDGSKALLLDGSRGRNLHADIPDLHHPVLTVAGEVGSSGADLMRLFRESPLRAHVGRVTDELGLEGDLAGTLKLVLPLHGEPADPEIDVTASLPGNRLHLRDAGLVADGVQGEVRYSSRQGLSAERLHAQLLESPVEAHIGSRLRQGELAEVLVDVNGRAGVPALRRWLGNSLLQFASGAAPYQARVVIPARSDAQARLQLESSLAGLRLDLPAPLGKGPEAQTFSYQSTLGGREQMARLRYGQTLAAGLAWRNGGLHRALVQLEDGRSNPEPAWPEQAGLAVEGRVARLDLGEWLPFLQRLQHGTGTVALAGAPGLPALDRLQLESRELVTEQLRLANAQLALRRQGDGWQVSLGSDELAGQMQWPDAPNREIRLAFSRLQWPLPAIGEGDAVALKPFAGLGNRPLLVNGQGLRLVDWPGLGDLSLEARLLPSPYGLRIEGIALEGPVLNFAGRLDWQWRGGASTRLRGEADTRNVAGLLNALGYAPTLVSDQASATLDLAWPGGPDKSALKALDGSLALRVEQGRLLNISNSTSASRVFGWFDVDNLKRRFKGDFSDVMRRGLSFDSARLEGDLRGGVMADARLDISGPTLKAEGQGRLDLARQEMDQQLTVVVPVSSAVPVAAIVVAGPLVGGAVAAAQMAFERQIDKVSQLRYHVTGDWANPRVERLNMKVFDLRSAAAVPPPALPLTQAAGSHAPTER